MYFNRWFSVVYHYMNAIRNNEDGIPFEIYATHSDPQHMALQASDVAEVEPRTSGVEYAQFCADFCRRHEIDIFIPRWNMLDISKHLYLFDDIGTEVMVCRDTELLEQLMEKDLFMNLFVKRILSPFPIMPLPVMPSSLNRLTSH